MATRTLPDFPDGELIFIIHPPLEEGQARGIMPGIKTKRTKDSFRCPLPAPLRSAPPRPVPVI